MAVEIKNLTATKCPVCQCDTIVAESLKVSFNHTSILTHTNGERWETRTFLCGASVEYIPNYGGHTQTAKCHRDPVEIEKDEKRKAIQLQIAELQKQLAST